VGDEVLHDVFVEVAQIARLILVDCLDAAPDHVLVPAQVTSATSCSCSGTWTMNAPPWVMTCEAVRACGRTLEDLRSPRPVIRGLPATAGSLRRFQADSGAGSTRDEKKPAVVMSNTYTDLQGFYGSDGTRTCDLRRDRPRRPSQRATHGNGFRPFSRFLRANLKAPSFVVSLDNALLLDAVPAELGCGGPR